MGNLSEDAKAAYSSYSCSGVFNLDRLEARSMEMGKQSDTAAPEDMMYTVAWLTYATTGKATLSKGSSLLSWQDLSTHSMGSSSLSKLSKARSTDLAAYGIAAIQIAIAEGSRGISMRAQGPMMPSIMAEKTGKISLQITAFTVLSSRYFYINKPGFSSKSLLVNVLAVSLWQISMEKETSSGQ